MPTTRTTLVDSFDTLRTELRTECINLDDQIDGFLVALAAGHHVMNIGEGGVGKSWLADRAVPRIADARKFWAWFSKFTNDMEILGPVSVPGIKAERYKRIVEGYLPDCHIAVLEEAGRASSSIISTLFGIANERKFKNDAVLVDVPVSTMVCNTNTLLTKMDPDLAPFEDRLLLRFEFKRLTSTADRRRLLDLEVVAHPTPVLTWAQVEQAKAEVAAIKVTDAAKEAHCDIVAAVERAGVLLSPRRIRQSLAAARARAWLDRATEADVAHLDVLMHCFWMHPEQASAIERIVLEVAAPGHKDALDAADGVVEQADLVEKLVAAIDKHEAEHGKRVMLPTDLMSQTIEVRDKVLKSARELIGLEATAVGRSETIVVDTWRRLDDLWATVQKRGVGVRTVPPLREEASVT